ncbi:hypothetical protein BGX28_009655 [Mortierella sp. GBA30]|nr:hypothetical protein BGX28_009655 [Mortierella sp. GBA30]
MFGQASDANNSRGPIALTDDDLEGATGLDWEDLEAQMQGVEEEQEEMEDMESTRVEESAAKPLKSASKKQVRYEDDDENDAAAQLLKPMSGQKGGRYKYDDGHGESDDEEEEEEGNSSRPYKDDDERDGSEDNVFTSNVWSRSHTDTETTEAATTRTDDTVLEVEEIPQDDPFKLEDADSELE